MTRLTATRQRSIAVLPLDPLDVQPATGYRIAFPDGHNVWRVTPAPDGTLLVSSELDGAPVALFTVDEPFETLTDDSVNTIALLWSRVLARQKSSSANMRSGGSR